MAKARVKWLEGMTYMGTDADGRGTLMSGDNGPGVSPMQMLLLGLGSCSSIDVVMILQKQRQQIIDVDIEIDGERGEEAPRPYKKIHMHYTLVGRDLDPSKVERALKLSTEKYCGVHGTLSAIADITYDYDIREPNDT